MSSRLFGFKTSFGSIDSDTFNQISRVYPDRVILVTSTDIKLKFPYADTIKDLEVIFYQVVNVEIHKLQQQYVKKKQINDRKENELVVYQANIGYSSVRYQFYIKVRETDKSIWLQQIGKHLHGKDLQNAKVTPNTRDKNGEIFMRRKQADGGVAINQYAQARIWGGEPLQEYSD